MGQPGNSSINHASITNYWNVNYDLRLRENAYTLFFLQNFKKLVINLTKYGYISRALFFYSPYFFDNKCFKKEIVNTKYFRKTRIFNRLLKIAVYYKIRRRIASYLNTKFWIYKYLNWCIIHSYSFRVFKEI